MASTTAIEAGSAFIKIMARDETKKELDAIGKRFKAWGAGLAAVGGTMMAASGSILAGMGAAVGQFMKVGSDLADMESRTGMAADKLSELGFVAGQSGASLDDLETGLKAMTKTTGKAGEEAFLTIADAIAGIPDPARRAQVAMALFGKSGTKLLPMLEMGSAGILEMMEAGKLLGNTMTKEDIAAADKLGDALGNLMGTVRSMVLQVGAAVAPLVNLAVNAFQPIATAIVRVLKENRAFVAGIAIAAVVGLVLGGVLLVAAGSLSVLGFAASGATVAVAMLNGMLAATTAILAALVSPLGLVVLAVLAIGAGLAALGIWFLTSTSLGKGFASGLMVGFQQLWAGFQKMWKGITDAIMAGNLQLAGKVAMAGLRVAWETGVTGLMEAWRGFANWFVDTISKAVTTVAQTFDGFVAGALAGINALLAARGMPQITTNVPKAQDLIGDPMAGFAALVKGTNDAAVAASSAALEKAIADFDGAVALAAAERSSVEERNKQKQREIKKPEFLAQASATGTFSGFAARMLKNAGGAVTPEVAELKEIKKGIQELVDKSTPWVFE